MNDTMCTNRDSGVEMALKDLKGLPKVDHNMNYMQNARVAPNRGLSRRSILQSTLSIPQ